MNHAKCATNIEALAPMPTKPPTPKKTGERYNLKVQVAKGLRKPNLVARLQDKIGKKAKRPEATPNFNSTLAWRSFGTIGMHGLDRVRSCGTGGESQFLQHDHLIPQWDGIKHARNQPQSPEHQLAPAQRGPQHGKRNRRQQTGGGGHGATRTSAVCDVGLRTESLLKGIQKVYPRIAAIREPRGTNQS